LTHYTFLLILAFLLVLFGAIGWVVKEKHNSKW
jgi:hypothetical protein